MFDILVDRTYRHLFAAQVVAPLGTGLATVALGLLAYDLAGHHATLVLGTVFTSKMVAYVGVAPFARALAAHLQRPGMLVTLMGAAVALVVLAGLALTGLALARHAWPARDPQVLPHRHDDWPPGHPHLREGRAHAHPLMIDDRHRAWPEPQS